MTTPQSALHDAAQKAASDMKKALNELQAAMSKNDVRLANDAVAELSLAIDALTAAASGGGTPVPGTQKVADGQKVHETTGGPKK